MSLPNNLGRLSAGLTADASLNIGVGVTPSGTYKFEVNGALGGTSATFSGQVGITTTGTTSALQITLPANANATILSSFSSNSGYGWKLQQEEVSTGDFRIFRREASVDYQVLNLARSTGAATFLAETNRITLANNFATTGNTNSPKLSFFSFGDTATYAVTGPSIQKVNTGSYGEGRLAFFQHEGYDFTNETEVVSIFAGGNVLIQAGGTKTDAGYKLDVNGTGRFNTSATTAISMISSATASGLELKNTGGTASDWIIQSDGGAVAGQAALRFYSLTASAYRMSIDGSGNVGIGTASPGYDGAGYGAIRYLTQYNAGGTSHELAGSSTANDAFMGSIDFINAANTGASGAGRYGIASIRGFTTNASATSTGGGYLVFVTKADGGSGAERMRITSDGFTKMSNTGTYDGSTGNYFEMISDQAQFVSVIKNTSSTGNGFLFYNNSSSNTTYNYIACYSLSANAYKLYLRTDGSIWSNTTSITPITSDVNLKTDIKNYDKGLSEVISMKPRYFKYKNDINNQKIGFIAQEMGVALNGSMINSNEKNEETGENFKTYQVEWYPLLVNAIKELASKNEELSAQIKDLQSQINK